jgi:hypothetical protein
MPAGIRWKKMTAADQGEYADKNECQNQSENIYCQRPDLSAGNLKRQCRDSPEDSYQQSGKFSSMRLYVIHAILKFQASKIHNHLNTYYPDRHSFKFSLSLLGRDIKYF